MRLWLAWASIAGAVAAVGLWARREAYTPVRVAVAPSEIRADGYSIAAVRIEGGGPGRPRVTVDSRKAVLAGISGADGRWEARLRAGIEPGRARVQVSFAGVPGASAELTTFLDTRDGLEDGTPDFLRLDDERDRQAFRRWFTYLAEAQYFQAPPMRPAEVGDCAALIRYAYREALHVHDGAWTAAARLPLVPPFDSVAKYQYPYTPLGAALFRVKPGPFRASDLEDGAFAQFADAQTLWRRNCHFVSRKLAAAQPGDLLFYRQEAGREPFHSMIYLGASQLRNDGERYLVYHTGEDEIRRPSVGELMRFPEPEWRPLESNASFLGVYRWNILCPGGTN